MYGAQKSFDKFISLCLIYATTETLLPAMSNLTQCNLNNLGSFPEIYLEDCENQILKKR